MPTNQFHEYNEEEFNSLPWANDFMNADPSSNEFNNAMAEADKYYGPEWTDKQLNAWGIQFEKEAEAGNVNPEQLPDNSPIQKEVEQLTDNNPNNNEIRNDAVEDFFKQMKAGQPSKQEHDEAAYRSQLNNMQLADEANSSIDNYDMLHFTPEGDKPTDYMWAPGSFMRKDIRDNVNLINSYPTSQKRAALELLARINNGDIDSYEDMMKANPWMDNAMFDAISSIASNDNRSGKIPVISKASLKRNKAAKENVENFIEQHPIESADILDEGPLKEEAEQAIDGGVDAEVNNKAFEEDAPTPEELAAFRELQEAENNIGMGFNEGKVSDPADWENNPTYHADPIELPDEVNETNDATLDVIDYGLEDQNVYDQNSAYLDETVVSDEKLPMVNYGDFQAAKGFEHIDNALELKPDETTEAETEEELEDQDEPGKFFNLHGLLGGRSKSISGASTPSASSTNLASDRLSAAGGSFGSAFRAAAAGSGSARSSNVSSGANAYKPSSSGPNRAAGGGFIPASYKESSTPVVAGNSSASSGFVASNGGNLGSAATNKRSSLVVHKTELPSFTGHTAPEANASLFGGENIDLHGALIEKVKGMLDKLDANTRKQLGFSPTLYNYKGTPFDKLDGSTLKQLSEMLEDMTE